MDLAWTVVLVSVGVTALWIAAKSWWGWALGAASEVLWITYAIHVGAVPLAIMACIWGVVNLRNALVTRRLQRA